MQVRRSLGIHDTAQTYVQLMAQTLAGWTPPVQLTETVTGTVFAVSVVGSVTWNVLDAKRAKRHALSPGQP